MVAELAVARSVPARPISAILAARHALYAQARERNPARWSRHTRNWSPIGAVTVNPERDSAATMRSSPSDRQPLAA
jgi:hypothetical protein